jgi:hypothetical protein
MILNQIVNFFPSASVSVGSVSYRGSKVTLRDILTGQHDQYRDIIQRLRNAPTEDVQKTIKRQELPCYYVSCYCEADGHGSRSLNDMLYHTGLIALDLDGIGENIHEIKMELISWPQVAYCSLSCRGNGLFALFRIEDASRHVEFYESTFPNICDELGIAENFDSSVKNINRLRYVTSDPDYYINDFPKQIRLSRKKLYHYFNANYIKNSNYSESKHSKIQKCIDFLQLNKIDIVNDYADWIRVGFSLAELGEQGRAFFHQISAINQKYNPHECDLKFTAILKQYNGITTLGTFFRMYELAVTP